MTSQHFRAVLAGVILVSDFCPGPLFAQHKIFQQKMLEGLDAFAGEIFSGVSFFVIHSTPQYLQLYKAFQPVLPILFTISGLCIVTVLASL